MKDKNDIEKIYNAIKKLPLDMKREILSFILYDTNNINFIKYKIPLPYTNYSRKYELAFQNNKELTNNNNLLLSKITKNNGSDRYYITYISYLNIYTDCGDKKCYSPLCKKNSRFTLYKSKYICKDLNLALCIFHTLY